MKENRPFFPSLCRFKKKLHLWVPMGSEGVDWTEGHHGDSHLTPECCLTGSVVYIGSAKSQQDQNLACKAQQLCKTNCGRQRSFSRVGNQHSTALLPPPSPPPAIYPPPPPSRFSEVKNMILRLIIEKSSSLESKVRGCCALFPTLLAFFRSSTGLKLRFRF